MTTKTNIEEIKVELRSEIVSAVINFFKRFKSWSDDNITQIDVTVEIIDSNRLSCYITLPEVDMDTKYFLCDVLVGSLYKLGFMDSVFECSFPDKIFTIADVNHRRDTSEFSNIIQKEM